MLQRLLYILILSISLVVVGCNNQTENEENIVVEEVEQYEVTISVSIPEEVDTISPVDEIAVTAEQGETIIEVTEKTDIELDVNGSGEDAYVEGINGLYAFDEGPESGWLVKVNDEFINVGPGAYNVEENDEIEWLYTTDFNKEFE